MPTEKSQSAATSRAPRVTCTHCGLPVPAGLIDRDPGAELQFCCNGCRGAYGLIHRLGLSEYYRVRDCVPAIEPSVPVSPRGDDFEHFDDPAFMDLYGVVRADGMSTLSLVLEGMHCAACIWLIERLPRILEGVIESRVDFRRRQVALTWDAERVSLGMIAQTLDRLGYTAHPASRRGRQDARRAEDRAMLIRIGVAGACTGNVMLLSVALYAGMFEGMATEFTQLFRWSSMVIGVIALAWPGQIFFRGAWAALRNGALNMDVPIALGLLAGGGTGIFNTLAARGEIYFDSVTSLVFLLLIGRWIQQRQQRNAADSVELLFSLTPGDVRVIRDGRARKAPLEAVERDEIIEVWPGERIPVDAVVTEGTSTIDLSLLSGESRPVVIGMGETMYAGAVNLSQTLRARVIATGQETRVARIMQLVEDAASRKPRIVQAADRIARWFV
ncbi:MAG: heavy metal translocating P-type ATPase, partial [Phycisphaerales bacterium]|nr:heavy metal translocating P-type ATPase [Phycisphaerales bacterium]